MQVTYQNFAIADIKLPNKTFALLLIPLPMLEFIFIDDFDFLISKLGQFSSAFAHCAGTVCNKEGFAGQTLHRMLIGNLFYLHNQKNMYAKLEPR